MNYRFCEKCRKMAYSTGKDYGNFIGEPMALILKIEDISKVEIKGLCPFCNPKSEYFQK